MPKNIPLLYIWTIIAFFVFHHHLRKNAKAQEDVTKAFWKKEESSLVVRKKELVDEDFIHPSLTGDQLKGEDWYKTQDQSALFRYEQHLKELLDKPMVNFQHMSNTDLRLNFGTANLTVVREYEENWNGYLTNLFTLGKKLFESGETDYSIQLLEEGIEMGTDNRYHFLLLGQHYKATKNHQAFDDLVVRAQSLESLTKTALLKALEDL